MMLEWLSQPWPWYVAGPLISLMIPLLLLFENKVFGLSSSFRHLCAAVFSGKTPYLTYNWKEEGGWNLLLVLGLGLGGWLAVQVLPAHQPVQLSQSAVDLFHSWGLHDLSGLVPAELFGNAALNQGLPWFLLVTGGFLVGFGTRYAEGCTSGHAISGLANLQKASLLAVLGFFAGGLAASWFLLPILFS